jgi:hypothetical protein
MLRQHIDPRYSQFFLDTCAFDPKYTPENEAADELWTLNESGVLKLVLAHSNQREIDHPNTPSWVRSKANKMIYTAPVTLTTDEQRRREDVVALLRGNATSDRHLDDAHHIFEASKYGGYFVTTDHRILGMVAPIWDLCSVQVMKPSDAIARLKT